MELILSRPHPLYCGLPRTGSTEVGSPFGMLHYSTNGEPVAYSRHLKKGKGEVGEEGEKKKQVKQKFGETARGNP